MMDWDNYTEHVWDWTWLHSVYPTSPAVRAADMDGWVEQGGSLLMLDGNVGHTVKQPSRAQELAVRNAGNITLLILRCLPEHWDVDTHRPSRLHGYWLAPGPWPARCYTWGRYARLDPKDQLSDVDTLMAAQAIVAQWAAWAVYGDKTQHDN